jgi:tryptophan 2,3-dioxygenase
MATAYWDYLRLDELLRLQTGFDGDETHLLPDELHFIVVHQTYELWFKLVLRSVRLARDHLAAPVLPEANVPMVVHHLRRVGAILKLGVAQFEVVETLTPQDFLAFRDKLVPASGFQSFQMRELEILLGLEDAARLRYGGVDPLQHIQDLGGDTAAGQLARARVATVRAERSLLEVLQAWLYRTPIQGSSPQDADDAAAVAAFVEAYLGRLQAAHEGTLQRLLATLGDPEALRRRFQSLEEAARSFLQADDAPEERRAQVARTRAAVLFLEAYRDLPLLAWPRLLVDTVLEVEEQLVLWRHRHARMVERTIGRRVGTGGSGGVDYLDQTGAYRVFRDLWAVRTLLLPAEALPPLEHADRYGFARVSGAT